MSNIIVVLDRKDVGRLLMGREVEIPISISRYDNLQSIIVKYDERDDFGVDDIPNMIRNAIGLKEIDKPEKLCTIKIDRDDVSKILAKYIERQGYHVNPEDIQFHLDRRLVGFRTDNEYETYFDCVICKGVKEG